jgi:hypothetical protein
MRAMDFLATDAFHHHITQSGFVLVQSDFVLVQSGFVLVQSVYVNWQYCSGNRQS